MASELSSHSTNSVEFLLRTTGQMPSLDSSEAFGREPSEGCGKPKLLKLSNADHAFDFRGPKGRFDRRRLAD
jgi:hypothetical protein